MQSPVASVRHVPADVVSSGPGFVGSACAALSGATSRNAVNRAPASLLPASSRLWMITRPGTGWSVNCLVIVCPVVVNVTPNAWSGAAL